MQMGSRLCLLVFVFSAIHLGSGTSVIAKSKQSEIAIRSTGFEVASIRASAPGTAQQTSTSAGADGYRARGQTIGATMLLAYLGPDVFRWSHQRLEGAPDWIGQEQFDIDARVSDAAIRSWQAQGPDLPLLREALQEFLAARCRLTLHSIVRETPIFALVPSKHGLRATLHTEGAPLPENAVRLSGELVLVPYQPGATPELRFYATSMKALASFLSHNSPRIIEDRTGLPGKYDFTLRQRDPESGDAPTSASRWSVEDAGLTLRSASALEPTLVIDHIERPTEN